MAAPEGSESNVIDLDSLPDDNGSPNKGTEAEPETTDCSFIKFLSFCGACKEHLSNREGKLLPCLHTFCSQCLTQDLNSSNTVNGEPAAKCGICHIEFALRDAIENKFVASLAFLQQHDLLPSSTSSNAESGSDTPTPSGSKSPASDEHMCTVCEENVAATSYCAECSDYLCDQCVQAHKRVKITKDHTIKPKNAASEQPEKSERQMYCNIHKQEYLVIFCESCDVLTCRNCQLSHHRDHKYAFVDEASQTYKGQLKLIVEKIGEKKSYIENAQTLISKRHAEIVSKERQVTQDVKNFAVSIITQINKRCKEVLQNLNSVCGVKKHQLASKHQEIKQLSVRLDHTLKFTQYLLQHGNGGEMLHSKRLLVTQLKNILRSRCEVPNPYHIVDIRFTHEIGTLLNAIGKVGSLMVDGVPYLGPQSNQMSRGNLRPGPPLQAMPPNAPASNAYNQQQQSQQRSSRAQQQMQIQQQLHLQQQQQQRSMSGIRMGSSSPTSTMAGGAGNHRYPPNLQGPMQRSMASQMYPSGPAQSSTISSSNHRLMNQWQQQQGMMMPPNRNIAQQQMQQQQQMQKQQQMAMKNKGDGYINLTQLAQQRQARHHQNQPYPQPGHMGPGMGGHMMEPPAQNPIVIQPISPSSSQPPNGNSPIANLVQYTDQMHPHHMQQQRAPPSYPNHERRASSEGMDASSRMMHGIIKTEQHSGSSQFGYTPSESPQSTTQRIKTEPISDNSLSLSDINFDDDPANFLESLKTHLFDGDLNLGQNDQLSTDNQAASSSRRSSRSDIHTPPVAATTPPVSSSTPKSTNSSIDSTARSTSNSTPDGKATNENAAQDKSSTNEDGAQKESTNKDADDATASENSALKEVESEQDAAEKDKSEQRNSQDTENMNQIESSASILGTIMAAMPKGEQANDAIQVLQQLLDQNNSEMNSASTSNENDEGETNTSKSEKCDSIPDKDPVHSPMDSPRTTPTPTLSKQYSTCSTPSRGKERFSQGISEDRGGDDPNEDWCAVCHNGGDLLCCENCPKVFHYECHIPQMKEQPNVSEPWHCRLCTPNSNSLRLTSVEEMVDVGGGKRKRHNIGLTEEELMVCERILLELFAHESSVPFHEPVGEDVPDYPKIIKKPMDFSTIRSKLTRMREVGKIEGTYQGTYNNMGTFIQDIKLVIQNCYTFNGSSSDLGAMGREIEQLFLELLEQFVPLYDPNFTSSRSASPCSNYSTSSEREEDLARKKKKSKRAAIIEEESDVESQNLSEKEEETPPVKKKPKRAIIEDEESDVDSPVT